jgi:flagellar motility protein MotE (MotC chaperone)
MKAKTLVLIVMAILSAFVIVMGAFFGLYMFKPDYLGIKRPEKKDSLQVHRKGGKIYNEPKISVAKSEFDSYQALKIQLALIRSQNLDVMQENRKILDSMAKVQLKSMEAITKATKIIDSATKVFGNVNKLSDSLAKYKSMFDKSQNELKSLKKRDTLLGYQTDSKRDSIKKVNFSEYSKIYNGMSPGEVSKILEKLDVKDAGQILKQMNKKKAAKVLDAISKEKAAAILLEQEKTEKKETKTDKADNSQKTNKGK